MIKNIIYKYKEVIKKYRISNTKETKEFLRITVIFELENSEGSYSINILREGFKKWNVQQLFHHVKDPYGGNTIIEMNPRSEMAENLKKEILLLPEYRLIYALK